MWVDPFPVYCPLIQLRFQHMDPMSWQYGSGKTNNSQTVKSNLNETTNYIIRYIEVYNNLLNYIVVLINLYYICIYIYVNGS